MRRPIIIANWKMNTTLSDALVLVTSIKNAVDDLELDVVLCPPFTWLVSMKEALEHGPSNLFLGAQNMWFASSGAMTGEISPLMLEGFADYVVLGHSERRAHLGESNALVNDKVHAALHHNLIPVIAVGEHKKMSEIKASSDIAKDFKSGLKGVSEKDAQKIIVAYEPIWAIGTGNAATGVYANEVIKNLREVFKEKYNSEIADEIKILYGGSVDSKNIAEFIMQPEIDGALVGGASLKSVEFIKICKIASGREE